MCKEVIGMAAEDIILDDDFEFIPPNVIKMISGDFKDMFIVLEKAPDWGDDCDDAYYGIKIVDFYYEDDEEN